MIHEINAMRKTHPINIKRVKIIERGINIIIGMELKIENIENNKNHKIIAMLTE